MGKEEHVPVSVSKGSVSVPERLKHFNETEHFAVLATDDRGQPYTSLISYAFTPDMKRAIFATPRRTRKYRNIVKGGYVALLIDNRSKAEKELMDTEAITVIGRALPIRKGSKWEELARIFMEKHPALKEFVRSPSTALVSVEVTRCIHVSRFQTVSVWAPV
jgi:nitroimidazol reductase NimA-like FMN-containing flavoprotein (pyridoxamine 5'-phosphate oxidase superfamily)